MLRNNLGDVKVAYFIFNHGVPIVLDLPLRRKAPSKALLQSMLEELMTWHASLLQSILEHRETPLLSNQRKLADLDEAKWRTQRRTEKAKAKEQIMRGIHLRNDRDNYKRKFEDMSVTEERTMQDFETRRSEDD